MKRKLVAIFTIAITLTLAIFKTIPVLLKMMGYHPDYD